MLRRRVLPQLYYAFQRGVYFHPDMVAAQEGTVLQQVGTGHGAGVDAPGRYSRAANSRAAEAFHLVAG